MKLLSIAMPDSNKPLYLRIAAGLREAFRSGQIRGGEQLPSAQKMANQLECHRHTVMAAISELIAEGWVVARKRRGYFVVDQLPDQFFQDVVFKTPDISEKTFGWHLAVTPSELSESIEDKINFSFHSGIADYALFPFQEFNSCFSEALRTRDKNKFRYGNPLGVPEFVDVLSVYMRRARGISDRDIVVTNGSQEGIFLTARLLLRPGDAVAVEDPGYPMAWEAFRSLGAKIVPVRMDRYGIDPDHLKHQIGQHPVRLLYTTPLHQFPTTVTIPVNRRIMIYEIAARHGVPILEDDYDHEYHYRHYPLSPLAASDPVGLVIYTSTFSKIIFPSLRLGFMALPRELVPALRYLRNVSTRQCNLVVQKAVANWIESGGFERHLQKMRCIYEARRNVMIDCMKSARQSGLNISWFEPDGGMAIWLDTKKDATRINALARIHGIHLLPESRFRLTNGHYCNLRLGFAHLAEDAIREGMCKVFQIIKEA